MWALAPHCLLNGSISNMDWRSSSSFLGNEISSVSGISALVMAERADLMRPRSPCKVQPKIAEKIRALSGLDSFSNLERWLGYLNCV